MELAIAINMSKRQKSSKGQDYISNLPDYIIGHILSFLPTADAVSTSVLSKRWIHMWTFITKLHFCDRRKSSLHRNKQFRNFVSKVVCHIKSTSIEDFDLSIGKKFGTYDINKWLSAVINRGVKNICVSSNSNYLSCYPLFQSPPLEKLALRMTVPCIIKVPTLVSFPSLTVLNLMEIAFTRYSSDKLKKLTLKLPLLRTYRAANCSWSDLESVTLEAPLLEEVIIEDVIVPFSITRCKSRTEIKFCASHLTKFVYRGDVSSLSDTILVEGHIASADIVLHLHDFENTSPSVEWVSLPKLLRIFTNAECLTLRFHPFECLAGVEHHLAGNPTFGMLSHMELNFVTREVLISLLTKSPCLKTLVLRLKYSDEETQNFAVVPDCFLSTLKVVKIECFHGRKWELSFAKFVMENARVLERINFSFHWNMPSSKMKKAKYKLFLFDKSFSTMNIEFSTYRHKCFPYP